MQPERNKCLSFRASVSSLSNREGLTFKRGGNGPLLQAQSSGRCGVFKVDGLIQLCLYSRSQVPFLPNQILTFGNRVLFWLRTLNGWVFQLARMASDSRAMPEE